MEERDLQLMEESINYEAMNEIHFYNSERKLEMLFSDFQVQKNAPEFHDFYSFQIDVKHCYVSASLRTECLDVDLVRFLEGLRKLYRMEVRTASFVQTIERNIELSFKLLEQGKIQVYVMIMGAYMKDYYDDITLKFNYGIDQSFLPELIQEIEAVIHG
ncbi:MAG: hypothetical protein IKP54_02655 [Bacteroidales bacterium]|nr:hypothetical protein [Bacteroidales bacterium]